MPSWGVALACLPLGMAAGGAIDRLTIWLPRHMLQSWGEPLPVPPAPSPSPWRHLPAWIGNPRRRLTELTTVVAFILTALRWGPSPPLIAALAATMALIALARIDWEHRLLPDVIVLPLMACGLAVNLNATFIPFHLSFLGLTLGYVFPWLLAKGWRLFRRHDGIGAGDVKFLAALGAWCGWPALPWVAIMASALTLAAALTPGRSQDDGRLHPYGTYLAMAGWLMLTVTTKHD